MSHATATLPPPTVRAESQAVAPWLLDHLERHYVARGGLAADIMARAMLGAERHGVPLSTHNGRSARVDAYQEALDMCFYAAQDHMEHGTHDTGITLTWALQMAERLRRQLGGEVR